MVVDAVVQAGGVFLAAVRREGWRALAKGLFGRICIAAPFSVVQVNPELNPECLLPTYFFFCVRLKVWLCWLLLQGLAYEVIMNFSYEPGLID